MRPDSSSPSERDNLAQANLERDNAARANEPLDRENPDSVASRGEFLADHRADRPTPARRVVTNTQKRVIVFAWLGMFAMLLYGLFTVLSAFNPGYRLVDYVALFMLLFGILFILMHGIGYAKSSD